MPRPTITEDKKLVPAQTRLSPAVIGQVERIAQEREWSFGQTLRKLIEHGLSAESAPPRRKKQHVVEAVAA